MARIKTRYVGIYYRKSAKRFRADGKEDICYDIVYKKDGKMVFEKVGWHTEGYTVKDAIELRGQRVKAIRHPNLSETEEPEKKEKEPIKVINITLDQAWEEYQINWLPNIKNAQANIVTYDRYIQPVFGNKIISAISRLDVEKFKLKLLSSITEKSEKPLHPSTVKEIIANLRRIINKAKIWGLVDCANPAEKIVIANTEHKRERYLTPEEADKILDGLQFISCVMYDIVKVALYSGLRLREILSIKSQDIDIHGGVIAIPQGKTGQRSAYISKEIEPILIKRMQNNSSTQHIFLSAKGKPFSGDWVSKFFIEVVTDMGFNNNVTDSSQRVVFHTLRHTFCSWLAIQGIPLFTISELVGHRTPAMTQRYAKLSPDSKRAALDILGQKKR